MFVDWVGGVGEMDIPLGLRDGGRTSNRRVRYTLE